MRRSLLTLMVLTSFAAFPAMAKDIPVESTLRAATVYGDRAMLTRRAEIEVPKGAHTIVFEGIPANLYPDSLRAEGASQANVTFGAVTHKIESYENYVVPKEKELNDKLVVLKDQQRILQADQQALNAGKKFLERLGEQAALRENEDIGFLDLKPEQWSAASDAIVEKIAANMKASIEKDIAGRKLQEEISKIQDELSRLRTGHKQTYSVRVPLESDVAGTLTVDLMYQVRGVSWRPVYDARLDTATGKLELIQYGSVSQVTGEDWSDIALTLSTAQPSRGAGLPDLPPKWVYLQEVYAKNVRRAGGQFSMTAGNTASMDSSPAYIAATEAAPEEDPLQRWSKIQQEPIAKEASFSVAQINNEGFVGEYVIPGPASVESGGMQAKLMIGGFETESTMQVQIKPQLSRDAYLVVKAKLKGENPILPGGVSLFRDGAYIGQGALPMLRPGDTEELAFGIDDNVRAKRNTLKDEKSESGLITKDQVIERHYVAEIQNLHKNPIEVVVLDTIPVSKDEKIRVDVVKDKTTPGYEEDVDNVKGLLRWTKTLEPQQGTAVNLGWKVSWPKDQNIGGL